MAQSPLLRAGIFLYVPLFVQRFVMHGNIVIVVLFHSNEMKRDDANAGKNKEPQRILWCKASSDTELFIYISEGGDIWRRMGLFPRVQHDGVFSGTDFARL